MAVYPINPGASPTHPDYSGSIIPTLWSRKLLDRFYDATVLTAISMTDYEGEIRGQGDKVVINQIPDITINNYRMGDELTYQRPAQTTIELLIDQGKSWSFQMDDVVDAQALIDMTSKWSENASEQLKITVDSDVLTFLIGKAESTNRGATAGRISGDINLGTIAAPRSITKADVIDLIVDLGTVLDEQNVPETGRKLVIPAWMAGMIKKSDLKDASLAGDGTSIVRNGRLGTIDRFELYVSNLLPIDVGGGTYIYALHPKALTFASQLVKTEKLRAQSTFGDLMRGLMVYGRKVIHPNLLAQAVVTAG